MERFRTICEIMKNIRIKTVSVFLPFAMLLCVNMCSGQNNCNVRLVKKFDIRNGGNAEIIQYDSPKNIIAATNSKNHYLDFYKVTSLSAGDIELIAGIKINSEPTSVAANDNKNFVVLSRLADSNTLSEIIFVDVNSFKEIKNIPFGVEIDSLAISPDGKWLVTKG